MGKIRYGDREGVRSQGGIDKRKGRGRGGLPWGKKKKGFPQV